MEKEQKSMNVDEEELEEGKAKEGEPLAKKYGYAEGTQQSAGVSVPQRSAAGGSTASSNAPAMFKSISGARDGLSKGVGRTSSEAPMTPPKLSPSSEQTQSPFTHKRRDPEPEKRMQRAWPVGKMAALDRKEDLEGAASHVTEAQRMLDHRKKLNAEAKRDFRSKKGDYYSEDKQPSLRRQRGLDSWQRKESDTNKKATKKSIEYTHGDQMKKGFSIGGTCGLCKRISKSITENVCEGCQSSMNTTQWHTSHLG